MDRLLTELSSSNLDKSKEFIFDYHSNTTFDIKVSNINLFKLKFNKQKNFVEFNTKNVGIKKIFFNKHFMTDTLIDFEIYDSNKNVLSNVNYNTLTKEVFGDNNIIDISEQENLISVNFNELTYHVRVTTTENNLNDKNNAYYMHLISNYGNNITTNNCEICDTDYKFFKDYKQGQYKSICPHCQSVYKHRCFANALQDIDFIGKKVLLLSPRTCDLIFFQNKNVVDYDIMDICSIQDDNRPKPNIVGDICDIKEKIEDNTYDSISSIATLSVVSNYDNAMNEVHRILKPNGTIYIVDEIFDENVDSFRKEETYVAHGSVAERFTQGRTTDQIRRIFHVNTLIEKYKNIFNDYEVKYGVTNKYNEKHELIGKYKYIILCLTK